MLFSIKNQSAQKIPPIKVGLERDIQKLFEKNLEAILDIKFLASEYSTSFGGRIDTLGIDNNGSPVIIEYKRGQNDSVINQGLSYLRWLLDHKEKFEALEKERLYLNTEATRLNKESSSINILTSELNKLLKERNIKATEYNKVAESYNQKYNQSLEFNQAEYTGKEINIYQFNNKKDLILALTHEFGHALGMDHVENAKSIMYYITGTDTETSLVLSAEDLAELNRVCKIK